MRTFAGMLAVLVALLALSSGPVRADAEEAAALRIESSLQNKVLAVVAWSERPLQEVLREIARETGINILVDTKNVDAASISVTLTLNNLPARAVLDIVLRQHQLIRLVQDGVVWVTVKDSKVAKPKIRTKVYDIRDITVRIRDFAAPEITLKGRDGGSDVKLPDDDKDPPSVEEIQDLIEEHIDPEVWGNNGFAVKEFKGQLMVSASNEVHRKVRRFLAQLRASR